MSEKLNEIFLLCDTLFTGCKIDYKAIKALEINKDFFEDYGNTRIVNSFLFNFSKLQDKIGAKLFKEILYELKEIDTLSIPMIDVLNILEKLEILKDKDQWEMLRELRNTLSHEYPFNTDERIENILHALKGYEYLEKIYKNIKNMTLSFDTHPINQKFKTINNKED